MTTREQMMKTANGMEALKDEIVLLMRELRGRMDEVNACNTVFNVRGGFADWAALILYDDKARTKSVRVSGNSPTGLPLDYKLTVQGFDAAIPVPGEVSNTQPLKGETLATFRVDVAPEHSWVWYAAEGREEISSRDLSELIMKLLVVYWQTKDERKLLLEFLQPTQ